MKYEIERTMQFKRDYKLAVRRGYDMSRLKEVICILAEGETLPPEYSDHSLSGDYSGYRECHVRPDWLLVYRITEEVLVLTLYRTGMHSDLF